MKIAVIAPSAMPARRANTIQTAKMAQAFARLGHEVLLIAPPSSSSPARGKETGTPSPFMGEGWGGGAQAKGENNQFQSPPPYSSPTRGEETSGWGGGWNSSFAHHYGLDTPFKITYLKPLPSLRRYDFALRALLHARRWGADLIYTRLPQAAALASLLRIPTIFEIHDLPQGGAAKLFQLFLRGRGAVRVVTITRALADSLNKNFPELNQARKPPSASPFFLVIPDGVELERYTPLLSPTEARQLLQDQGFSLPDQFIAGYTGHLYAGRGIELILHLAGQLPEILFLLVGGEEADIQRWRSTIQEQALQNVFLRGFVSNAELPLYQMACDVLLMPYQTQIAASSGGDIAPFLSPMKLFEYLACGRPILSSDLPVFREILSPENAVLLPPQDFEAWENALRLLQASPEQRSLLAENARHTASQYTWETRARRILPLSSSC